MIAYNNWRYNDISNDNETYDWHVMWVMDKFGLCSEIYLHLCHMFISFEITMLCSVDCTLYVYILKTLINCNYRKSVDGE